MSETIIEFDNIEDGLTKRDQRRRAKINVFFCVCNVLFCVIGLTVFISLGVFGAVSSDECDNGASLFLMVIGIFMASDIFIKSVINVIKIFHEGLCAMSSFNVSDYSTTYNYYKKLVTENESIKNSHVEEGEVREKGSPRCSSVSVICCIYWLISYGVQLGIFVWGLVVISQYSSWTRDYQEYQNNPVELNFCRGDVMTISITLVLLLFSWFIPLFLLVLYIVFTCFVVDSCLCSKRID